MTAARKINFEAPAAEVARKPAAKLYVVGATPVAAEAPAEGSVLKNVALFLVSPFIGLAYIVAFPFVGLAVMAMLLARVAAKFTAVKLVLRTAKATAMVVGAPFIGLAYVVFFPFVALGALVWVGAKAARN